MQILIKLINITKGSSPVICFFICFFPFTLSSIPPNLLLLVPLLGLELNHWSFFLVLNTWSAWLEIL